MILRNHPSEATLIKALDLNDQHIRGLTRLDQQIVYVPLVLLAGIVHDVLTAEKPFISGIGSAGVWIVVAAVAAFVLLGLTRNEFRHGDLLADRTELRHALGLRPEHRRGWRLLGRAVYFLLFAIGAAIGGAIMAARLG